MYYSNNSITIYYKKYGNSPKTILILPGWGNNRNTFNNLIIPLKKDYTIYIIDYPYFGNSPIPNKELTIYDYSNLIKETNATIKECKVEYIFNNINKVDENADKLETSGDTNE